MYATNFTEAQILVIKAGLQKAQQNVFTDFMEAT